MSRYIIHDDVLLHFVAKNWILPMAAGNLPPKYRDHLAGEQLVALSKRPKQGIRPINVSDAWRRITAKGLLQNCLRDFRVNMNSFFNKAIREYSNLPQQQQMEQPSCSTSTSASRRM